MYIDMRNPPNWPRPWDRFYRRWLERVAEAETLGARTVWLTEHHFFDDGYLPQCWTFAAAIAARTTGIRIGTAVALLPLHQAVEWAEQIALVDVISGGRVEPGFGLGYRKPEYLAFAGDFKHRYAVFADRITEMRQLWGEEPGATRPVTPPPLQKPVPMWGGFGGPRGARLAGRLGLGLQSIDRRLLEPYREGLEAGGYDPSQARMSGPLDFFLTDDPDRTWAEIEPHVRYRQESYNRYMFEGTSQEGRGLAYFDLDAMRSHFLLGTPEEVAAGIRKRTDGLPVTDLFGWCDFPGLPDPAVDRHIELTFTRLAPLLAAGDPA
jgi:alkanesulfonate monooxygenase SsuD/methylene tetrahydromethanopterin reductase-like flavin-dependent oxidoreductase (luciferase family)